MIVDGKNTFSIDRLASIKRDYVRCGLDGWDFEDDCGWCWVRRSPSALEAETR